MEAVGWRWYECKDGSVTCGSIHISIFDDLGRGDLIEPGIPADIKKKKGTCGSTRLPIENLNSADTVEAKRPRGTKALKSLTRQSSSTNCPGQFCSALDKLYRFVSNNGLVSSPWKVTLDL